MAGWPDGEYSRVAGVAVAVAGWPDGRMASGRYRDGGRDGRLAGWAGFVAGGLAGGV